jgi:hypothetical protein
MYLKFPQFLMNQKNLKNLMYLQFLTYLKNLKNPMNLTFHLFPMNHYYH